MLIEPDGFDQVTFGITLEYHFCAIAVLIAADNNSTLFDAMHLWAVQTKSIGFFDCSARSANLMSRPWAILTTIMASAMLVLSIMITVIVVAVMNIVTTVMNAGSITQIEIDADISSIGISKCAQADNAGDNEFYACFGAIFQEI
ncbi:MAG: hypothetical protein GY761_20965 [Hyphomicrobiales bacterium]|nr:hypothetical protein [Hyphomicrobiales bacterium]